MFQVENLPLSQDKNPKKYNSPQSAPRLMKKPDQTTSDLFGNYKEEPVIRKKPENFVPTFEIKPANIRKNMDFYGTEKVNEKKAKENKTNETNSTQKKMNELTSNIFHQEPRVNGQNYKNQLTEKLYPRNAVWTDNEVKMKNSNEQIEYEKLNNSKKNDFQKGLIDNKNNDKRKGDRNYSDLFGRETLASQKSPEKNKTCTTMKWTDIDSSKLNGNNKCDSSPKERKKNELKSFLDTENLQKIREESYEVPVEKEKEKNFIIDKDNTSKCLKKLQMESNIIPDYKLPFTDRKTNDESRNKVEVFDFDIKGLSEKFDAKRFNRFCKTNGYHLVSFKSDFNSVLNKCGQYGRLQLRANDDKQIASIKSNLKEFGVELTPHIDNLAKKSNYLKTANVDWKEDILPKEERRLHSRNFLSPQHSKMKDLESNRDVFGNGVDEWKNSHINEKKGRNSNEDEKKNKNDDSKRSSKVFEPVLHSKR